MKYIAVIVVHIRLTVTTMVIFWLILLVFSFFLYKCHKQIIYSGPIPNHGNTNECVYLYLEIAVKIKDDDSEIFK